MADGVRAVTFGDGEGGRKRSDGESSAPRRTASGAEVIDRQQQVWIESRGQDREDGAARLPLHQPVAVERLQIRVVREGTLDPFGCTLQERAAPRG